jgi:hypothetical protein
MTDLSHGAHGGQSAREELACPIAIPFVGGLRFQQLGMGQDDAELVVQAVKQRLKCLAVLRFVGPGAGDRRRQAHACEPGAVLVESDSSERAGAAASRHSVSAKIRMDPPAVRTYSTLPAEIQL